MHTAKLQSRTSSTPNVLFHAAMDVGPRHRFKSSQIENIGGRPYDNARVRRARTSEGAQQ
eukprot:13562830-Alexandrium_andersonii.AAC.1